MRLTLYNGSFDETLASFIGRRQREGDLFELDELLLLSYLREHPEVDTGTAARLCQLPESRMKDRLDQMCMRPNPWLDRRFSVSAVKSVRSVRIVREVFSMPPATKSVTATWAYLSQG